MGAVGVSALGLSILIGTGLSALPTDTAGAGSGVRAVATPGATPAPALAVGPTTSVSAVGRTSTTAAASGGTGWDTPAGTVAASPGSVVADAPARGPVRVVTVTNVAGRPRITTTMTSDRQAAEAAVAAAQQNPATVSVGVDHVLHLADASVQAAPQSNDTDRSDQWALTRLRAEDTWSRTTGSGVTVAVVDTGVEAAHPDLTGAVLGGTDLVGDATSADGTVSDNGWADENGHGTHVAGIIAAVAGNGIGIAGLAPGVKILPVRVLDGDGAGYDSTIARGIIQAVSRGADVINLSMGGVEAGATATAVKYALSKNVVVVAAVGNERGYGNATSYPAADAGVIGVAATDSQDADASFSNTGSYVDVAAPGVRIWSTYKGDGYRVMDGTSMATPYVAATVALLRTLAPGLTPAGVTRLLEQTATDLGKAGRDDATGYGLIDPYAAVCSLTVCDATSSDATSSPAPGGSPTGSPEPGPEPGPGPATIATRIALTGGSGGTVAFGTKAAVRARVVAADTGEPLVEVPADVCVRAVPATVDRCTTLTTDADGTISYTLTLQGQTSVHVRYAGSATTGASTSATVTYRVTPQVTARGGHRRVSADVTPGAGRVVTLDRWTGHSWSTVRTARATAVGKGSAVGRVTFTRLPVGSYRVRTTATAALTAKISATIRAT